MSKLTKSAQRARDAFVQRFGLRAFKVVELFEQRFSNAYVARTLSMPRSVVAAYRANWTRGTYDTVACRFVPVWSDAARDVVDMIRDGMDSTAIARATGLSLNSVAAFRANETRGAYADMA